MLPDLLYYGSNAYVAFAYEHPPLLHARAGGTFYSPVRRSQLTGSQRTRGVEKSSLLPLQRTRFAGRFRLEKDTNKKQQTTNSWKVVSKHPAQSRNGGRQQAASEQEHRSCLGEPISLHTRSHEPASEGFYACPKCAISICSEAEISKAAPADVSIRCV